MVEGRDTLKLGLIKRIGNGTTTNIWNDNWLPWDEMLCPYGCISHNRPNLVSELIDPMSTTWIRQRVEEVFMPMDVSVIDKIPLCTRNISDFWSLNFEKNGNFLVKSQLIECLFQPGKGGRHGLMAPLARPGRTWKRSHGNPLEY